MSRLDIHIDRMVSQLAGIDLAIRQTTDLGGDCLQNNGGAGPQLHLSGRIIW